ncbi:P-loop containing nucleoside triphosphate hydrolase protein [Patellaria atrata CBS 101060]|uniref:P-loop containing nucleoside triphosphate hydrolase protein n=1 Tax=Patellaria atrata CBS 101060 TaxID=1346257 RepID=A0A9P4S6U0_9PEZI|nr:P-loop containing nucleoside triphosphate hydrolase protein [Patellaria atrata CBS 101060]
MAQACHSDSSFGPWAGNCRDGFDFTLLFEESVLGLLPQSLLLLLGPLRLITLRKRRRRVAKGSHLGFIKLVASTLYAVSSVLLLILWSELNSYRTNTSIASACLEFLASITVLLLSRAEHQKAVRPSHLLQFFLLVMLICDVVRLRTLFLMAFPPSLLASASVHTFLTGILLLFESLDKRQLLAADNDRKLAPEETTGLFAERFFWWMNDLFKEGYRKVLTPDDLYSIDEDLTSEAMKERFQKAWKSVPDKNRKNALIGVIIKTLGRDLLIPVLPRVLFIGTEVAQPFLIASMVSFVQRAEGYSKNIGYGLVAAFALNYTLYAITSTWHSQAVARFSTKLRACIISTIYDKTLQTHPSAIHMSSATVLMNVDVEKVVDATRYMHDFWAVFISSCLGFYILYTRLGVAFIAALVTILTVSAVCLYVSKIIKPRQEAWMAATEKRVTTISHCTAATKGIRMLGLVETVRDTLTNLREDEVEKSRHIRKLLLWVFVGSNVLFQLTVFTTFTCYALIKLYSGGRFYYTTLFTSVSALRLSTTPLLGTLQHIPRFQNGLASLERVQEYLAGPIIDKEPTSSDKRSTSNLSIQLEDMNKSPAPQHRPYVVQIRNASFEIESGKPLISDINLSLPSGSFTMIVGKVASGKSVLLHSLVRETILIKGTVEESQMGIAFCAQTPWLRNSSIRDNIVGEDLYDHGWYDRVIWCCGLRQDFEELKAGDQSMVGSKGITLSGGQKNRIALARAVYSRKSTLVIDDVLSGLDSTTEKLVFTRIFGRNGILRKCNATIILATHSTHWLSTEADNIVIMSSGRIVEQGTFAEISTKSIYLPEICRSSREEQDAEKEIFTHEDIIDEEWEVLKSTKIGHPPVSADPVGDDFDRRSGDIRCLLYFLDAIGKPDVILYMLNTVISAGATAAQFIFLKIWAASDNSTHSAVSQNIGILGAITVLDFIFVSFWIGHFAIRLIPNSSLALHGKQLDTLMRATFSFITTTDIGSITNRFSQDMIIVDIMLPFSWINVSGEAFKMLAQFCVLIIATPPIAAVIPFLLAVAWLIQRVYLRTSRQVRLMDLEAKSPLCTHFLETLSGISTVRAFGWSEAYKRQSETLLDKSNIPFYLLLAIQNWLKLVLELMVAGIATLLVGLAIPLRDKLDPGFLGLALVSIMDLGLEIRILITSWTDLETSLSAVARIRSFVNTTPSEERDTSQPPPPLTWPTHGALEYRNVTASYSPTATPVLQDLNLRIAAGEKIGICGRTGSGKSTLVATLFGLLHQPNPSSSEILIDDVPTSNIPLAVLRSKIVALPQDPLFLHGSVRENLTPWRERTVSRPGVPDSKMVEALREVGLWEKLVLAKKEEESVLDVKLDNVEGMLSQGERQLFCLARAMVMEGRIVVLDEATSSVDAATDALMQRILRTRFADRTIIAIAHRLDTILDFDRVVVMDAGRIAEVGDPRTLMDTDGSMFRGLVEVQGRTKARGSGGSD